MPRPADAPRPRLALSRRTALTGLAAAPLLAALPSAARAHHGWSSFDSARAWYFRGRAQHVRWGSPHSEALISVDAVDLPEGFRDRPVPQGGDDAIAAATFASARPYGGEMEALRLILASPRWMERWGLTRPIAEGETIEALGFLSSARDEELRPVMFWMGDGQGVWQQLTALPRPPEPA